MSIMLPEQPEKFELEDYLSAYFASGNYFLDRGIEEHNVLELDLFATDYVETPPENIIVEEKSGKWGLKDVFKLRGWLDYLSQNSVEAKGFFIATKTQEEIELGKPRGKPRR